MSARANGLQGRHLWRALGVAVCCATLIATSDPSVGAETTSSTTTPPTTGVAEPERDDTEIAASLDLGAEPSIDVLQANATEVRAALANIKKRRSAAEVELVAARRRATVAAADSRASGKVAARAEAKAAVLTDEVTEAGIDAYVGNHDGSLLGVLRSSSAEDAAVRSTFLQYEADELTDLLDRHRVAREHARRKRAESAVAADAAASAEQAAQAKIEDLIATENDQVELVSQVEQRLDAALAESAALEAIDALAAAEFMAQEVDLHDQVVLASTPVPPTDPSPAADDSDPTPTPTTAPPTTVDVTDPAAPTTAPAPPTTVRVPPTTAKPRPTPTIPLPIPARVDVVSVGGIYVARSIAVPMGKLLAAAKKAGLVLSGGGYRSAAAQIATRKANCGPTYYDIYQKPSSQCSPPTARPGKSMHEKGLAVDLTCSGSLIRSRTNPCFLWLSANAAKYGMYNLPSEPWHWSTNGN